MKLRAWHHRYDEGKMIYLQRSDNWFDYENGLVIAFSEDGYDEYYAHERYQIEDKPILMQCSPFLDVDGKDIYEGDIIRYTSFDKKEYVVECPTLDKFHWWSELNDLIEDGSKVILLGNIYQNPELLKQYARD